jgi:hypothetical protein
MKRVTWILLIVMAAGVGGTPGEVAGQAISCPPPQYTEEEMLERLVRLGESPDGASRVRGQITSRMLPLTGCAFIPTVEDPEALVRRLVELAASEGSPELAYGVFWAVTSLAMRSQDPVLLPLDALVDAVEAGQTRTVRSSALAWTRRVGDQPGVRSQILDWLRAERGPPAFPDLPDRLYRNVMMGGVPGGASILEELEADLEAIENPAVRCRIENRHLEAYSGNPGRPTLRTECPPLAFEGRPEDRPR